MNLMEIMFCSRDFKSFFHFVQLPRDYTHGDDAYSEVCQERALRVRVRALFGFEGTS